MGKESKTPKLRETKSEGDILRKNRVLEDPEPTWENPYSDRELILSFEGR